MSFLATEIERLVLNVHHRNGGKLARLDFNLRLLDPSLVLDSLDLAEIVVAIEKQFNYSPFDASSPPRTWGELARQLHNALAAHEQTARSHQSSKGKI